MSTWDDEAREQEQEPEREYEDVVAFVRDFLAPTYRRPLGHGLWWCSRWYMHAEACRRLLALWEAYEELRAAPLGMSDWWLNHCDPTMRALMAPDGPFCECAGGHRERLAALPVEHDER